ncbi:hypothetical protein PLICRDRAFT_259494 [Plicaturopsis crispa FD-325 SS-3]|nr:hypothetical protein PLICRDRAFT_259494 [Plicaturopsis crispa FD-325 SS-3]
MTSVAHSFLTQTLVASTMTMNPTPTSLGPRKPAHTHAHTVHNPYFLDRVIRYQSDPIEIPKKQRRSASPSAFPSSPDDQLIFDMSPVDARLHSHMHDIRPRPGNAAAAWRTAPPSPTNSTLHEPFLYTFPRPSHFPPRSTLKSQSSPSTPKPPASPPPPEYDDLSAAVRSPLRTMHRQLTSAFWHEDELPSEELDIKTPLSSSPDTPSPTPSPVEDVEHLRALVDESNRVHLLSPPPPDEKTGHYRMRRSRYEKKPMRVDREVVASLRADVET